MDQLSEIPLEILSAFRDQVKSEAFSILDYWINFTVDAVHGGFFGQTGKDALPLEAAPKGLVLNARILWTFSAAFRHYRDDRYHRMATRAFDYLLNCFTDPVYGGFYWTVDNQGKPLNDRKQIYGLAFCMYGLSEYYTATGEPRALEAAIELFRLIEEKSFDPLHRGYFEAFARDWSQPEDLRLSPKDANEKKSMNTHLHIIEAYANLYGIWQDPLLRQRITGLLDLFASKIIDRPSGHLLLFFEEDWRAKSTLVSYGHDIEAAWLLADCAQRLQDQDWILKMKALSLQITAAAMEGLDSDGGLWYEFEPTNRELIRQKHWWPQAEAMVGFFHCWELTGDKKFLDHCLGSWDFIRKFLIDPVNGEWFWGIGADHSVLQDTYKTGFWKCPYHNVRACLEIEKRVQLWLAGNGF